MESSQTADQFWSPRLIFGLITLFSLIYFNLLYLRWETLPEILQHLPRFIVLSGATGIILSTLSLKTPYTVAFLATASLPLACLGFKLFSDLLLSLVHAGTGQLGGSLSALQFAGLVLVLLIVGIVLGAVADLGCYGGLVLQRCINLGRHHLGRRRLQRGNQATAPQPELFPRIAAKLTLLFGIVMAATSVLQSLI